jgi:hypothetical protein
MLAIHPQARTTPAVRAEIARSHESSGVSIETVRKCRKLGPDACQGRSAHLTSSRGAPAMRSAPSCARSTAPPAAWGPVRRDRERL